MTICNRMVSIRIVPVLQYTQLRFIIQINKKVIEMEAVSSRTLVKNRLKFRPNGTLIQYLCEPLAQCCKHP